MRPPRYWYEGGSLLPVVLSPISSLYGMAGRLRMTLSKGEKAPVPVICIGNMVAGGAGKTPVALSVAERLISKGVAVHFLSRGYGGHETGPLRVDPEKHTAADVGDEPLLLSAVAPTWIAADRPAGARAAAGGADVIVMDDGFQNPSLEKDLSIVVVDGEAGFGNGKLIPAGPLRERPEVGLRRAQAVAIIGGGENPLPSAIAGSGLPILRGHLTPGDEASRLTNKPVVAFAGIARPEKFFATLRGIGCDVAETCGFGDHHPFSQRNIDAIRKRATELNAVMVTTEKDAVRLDPEFRNEVEVLTVRITWQDTGALESLLQPFVTGAI